MTSSYRIGDADRDAAVERLRGHRDAGRLSDHAFQQRVATALDARTQADLDPLFADLPHEPQPGTFELYPHQAVAPYVAPEAHRPDWSARTEAPPRSSSDGSMSIKLGKLEISIPPGALVVAALIGATILVSWAGWGWWWIFFLGPLIANSFPQKQRKKRRRRSD
ncbi:MAG: DUF1707 domain-containing protein [Actinomycetia bacterium]|nr:DUF1707 domain-containing protein [Actinomycetes bacterium]